MDASRSQPVLTPVRRRPSLDFSLTGVVYCSMMMFMGLAAMNTQANLLFGVFGLMIGILLISGVVSRIVLRKLSVHRQLPKHGIVGEPALVYFDVSNEKRYWPSLSVSLAELDGVEGFTRQPQYYLLHAAPKMTASVPVELIPKRRGLAQFDHFQLSTSFPFGFIKRAIINRHKETMCVFPAIATVDPRVIAMCRSADHIGEAVRPQAGGTDEFYGLREYRPGDNPRSIYWRRSARTGVLVAKDMARVSPPRLLLIVDTYLPEPSLEGQSLVERVIAMAGSLASAGLERELSVGLCAWSGKPITIAPSRGKQQREDLLTLLAQLPANTGFKARELLGQADWMLKNGTTLIFLTPGSERTELAENTQGGMITLAANSATTRAWFHFRPEVNFESCSPVVTGNA